MILHGRVRDRSSNFKVIIVGCASPNFNFLKIDHGMRLMIATRSHRDFSKTKFPIAQGMVKLLGSFSLGGNFFYSMALHSLERATVS